MRDVISNGFIIVTFIHIHAIKLTNQCQCYVITLKLSIVIFVTVENQTSRHFRKTTVNKLCLFLALRKDFSAVSAGGSEVIAYVLDGKTTLISHFA